MPTRPMQLCVVTGCGNLVTHGRCPEHRTELHREADKRRPSAAVRGYGKAWQRIRAAYLTQHPLCEGECSALPAWQRPAATDVDHVDGSGPHGDNSPANLQALCHPCHSRKTVRADGGFGRHPASLDGTWEQPGG